MTSITQQEALAVLTEIWALSPDVRLGQLMAHLGFLGEVHLNRGLGYIDDDELLSILYRHRAELLTRGTTTAPPDGGITGMPTTISGIATSPDVALA